MLRFPWAKYGISKLLLIFDYNMDRCDRSECTKVKLKAKCSNRVKKRQVQVLVYTWLGNEFYISTTLFAAPIFFHKFQLSNFRKPHPCFKIHLVILIAVFLGNTNCTGNNSNTILNFCFLGKKKKTHNKDHPRCILWFVMVCSGVINTLLLRDKGFPLLSFHLFRVGLTAAGYSWLGFLHFLFNSTLCRILLSRLIFIRKS